MNAPLLQPRLAQAADFIDSDPQETAEWRDALRSDRKSVV